MRIQRCAEVEVMLFELRQFRIKDGKRERWVRLIEEKIIPFQISKGIIVIASFVAVDEPDLYIWIRRLKMRRKLRDFTKTSMKATNG